MYKVIDFIKWALLHIKPYTVPSLGTLVRPWNECGIEPWEYLYGSVRVKTTQEAIDRYFTKHYCNQYSRAEYDKITRDWDRNGYATDCEGLLDAYLTYECGVVTDINANMNYDYWCTEKGKISEIDRPYVIGEALFMGTDSKKTHIGWVCGFDTDGSPYVVEARGINYGVVITKFHGRSWKYRGLMTQKFDYTMEPEEMVKFEVTKPMHTGEPYLAMQKALNLAGYTDDKGRILDEDGKWGNCSQQAFNKLIEEYAPPYEPKKYTVTISEEDTKLYNWECEL